MPENPRIPLPFGQGLDRETGVMAVRPGTFEDIRNVLLHQGKAMVRPGFESQVILYDDEDVEVSHIVQGYSLRSERIGVVVSYQEATEKVWVHRIDTLGLTAELIGEWENDLGWGDVVPRVSMCEVYGRVFMAHNTRSITVRAPTIYYDPIFGATPLNNLVGNFTGAGDFNIRFRKVRRHLAYLFGAGYGTELEDRPELVRVSNTGDPTLFSAEHYFIVGDRRDPVMTMCSAGRVMIVLKETEGYVITGSGRDDFAIFLQDPLFGCIGSQLAANMGGLVVAWSAEGPRIWDGSGPSRDAALLLELSGPEPSGLVAEGDTESAFAAYIPDLRVVAFFFGQRVYTLTTRVENDWKWHYWPLGFTPLCAFTLYPGTQDTEAPTGYPRLSGYSAGGTYADLTIQNIDQDGDETLEIWLAKDDGVGGWDPFYLAKSVLVSVGTPQSPVPRVEGLVPGTDYTSAMRYRRGTLYTEGYESSDPWDWPDISRAVISTSISPPTWVSGVWSRTATAVEQILVTVTPAVGQEDQDIEVWRNGALVHTIVSPVPFVGDASWADPITGLGETDVEYEFLTKGISGDSIKSDVEVVWAGPPTRPIITYVLNIGLEGYEVGWGDGMNPDNGTELWDNYDDAGGVGPQALRTTSSADRIDWNSGALSNVPASPGIEVDVKLRDIVTAFGTDDYTPFSLPQTFWLKLL